ncbi:FecR family protein [Acinetobacter rudis]|uniref:FecR family protein n=1 Tax=Acinetobacter rudis TaxID=632955 RepID=UPI00333EB348
MLQQQIYQEAAEWILKKQQGTLTEIDQTRFEQWKQQSSAHQAAWEKAERLLMSLSDFPDDGQQLIEKGKKNSQLQLGSRLLLVGIFCFGGGILWSLGDQQRWLADYSTAVGQQKHIELEDGTQLQINTNTALDVHYSAERRSLKLHYGEIQIRTAHETHQPYRPFFVETPSANLQALGTVFNVQYLKNNADQTCLGVIESAVKVSLKDSKQSKILHAGQQLCFDQQNFKVVHDLDPNLFAWKNQVVMAFEMPLEQLMQEIGRYQHQYIKIDPKLKSLKVSGSYPVNDFNALQNALELSYPVKVQRYMGDHVMWIQTKAEKVKNN